MSQHSRNQLKVPEGNRVLAVVAYILPLVGGIVTLSNRDDFS